MPLTAAGTILWLINRGSGQMIHRVAVIEAVHATPVFGCVPNFNLGYNLGWVEGVLAAHGFTIERVSPSRWKRHFSLPKDKEAARRLAQERFPALTGELGRKKDHGRAEALLIGLYWQERKGRI